MAGRPPKPPPPTIAAGSSSSPKPRPTLAAGSSSSSPKPPPPPNFTRHPSDEELMNSYLRPRVVSGTKFEAGFIHEADLYSADPDLLTSNRNYAAATANNGKRAWYFFTPLRPKVSAKSTQMNRSVDTGRKGTWFADVGVKNVLSNGEVIGQSRGFNFKEKVGDSLVKSAWRMMELRLNPNEGGQEARSSNLLALCKVYRSRHNSKQAAVESSMAVAKADGEAPAASAVVMPWCEGADEEIGADTAAGPVRKKRKTGGEDSGAETVASSPGRQNEADGEIESTDAATTGQIFADGKDPLDAAEKAQQEKPRDLWEWDDPRGPIYDVFSDYSCWW